MSSTIKTLSITIISIFLFILFTNQVKADISTGLVGWWKFDEGSGTTALDSSGGNNVGTLINTPARIIGKIGSGALQFNGINNYVNIGSPSTLLLNSNLTISAWIYTPNTSGEKPIVSYTSQIGNKSVYSFEISGSKSVLIQGDQFAFQTTNTNSIQANSWTHLSVVRTGSSGNWTIYYYLNGTLDRTVTTTIDPSSSGTGIKIGRADAGYFTGGVVYSNISIDDLRIYNRALSASDISELYSYNDSTLPIPTPQPVVDTQPPSTPTNLNATAVSTSQVNLSWNASTDNVLVSGYKVYRDGSQITATNATSFSNTGLSPGTNYSYAVSAYDGVGNESLLSNSANVTTQIVPSYYSVNIYKSGNGGGMVTATGISCGSDCSESIASGSNITLIATADQGSLFSGWSGGLCVGNGSCTITVNSNTNITANFTLDTTPSILNTYYVSKNGNDSNPGTQQQPWLTVQKALNSVNAGDTVIVQSGRYQEIVQTKRAGTQEMPITYTTNGDVEIYSFGINHDWSNVQNFKFISSPTPVYAGITYSKGNIKIVGNIFSNFHVSAIRPVDSNGSLVPSASWPTNVYIANNQFKNIDTTTNVILFMGNNSIIENNIFDSNAADIIDMWGDNNIFRKNTITNTKRDTIGLSLGSENHNDFIQTWYAGAGSHSRNVLVEGNYLKDNYFQLYNLEDGNYQADFNGWTFRNNVFINSHYNGNSGITNLRFYNNTYYRSPHYPGFVSIAFFNQDKFHSAGGIVKNNLFISGGYYDQIEGLKLAGYGSGFDADYNFISGLTPDFPAPGTSPSFSEVHGINGSDPLFVDVTSGDLRLRPSSPAIGAGVNLSSVAGFNNDIDGNPRPVIGPWTIGAYEYSGVITSTPTPSTPASGGGGSTGGGGSPSGSGGGSSSPTGTFTPTVTQKPLPAGGACVPTYSFTRTLTLGSTGQDVKALQIFLNTKGYTVSLTGPGSQNNETTYFGPATIKALAKFQQANNILPANGYLNATTLTKVNSLSTTTSKCSDTYSAITPTKYTFTRTLKIGSVGTDVKYLQIFLNDNGFTVSTTGPGSKGNESTYFGPATQKALIKYQEYYAKDILTPSGLTKGTGYFGPSTMKKVNGR